MIKVLNRRQVCHPSKYPYCFPVKDGSPPLDEQQHYGSQINQDQMHQHLISLNIAVPFKTLHTPSRSKGYFEIDFINLYS